MACVSKIGFGYVIVTKGVISTASEAVYGIDPGVWKSLPCEGVALFKIRHVPLPDALTLPLAVAVPTSSTVTTVGDGSSCCSVTNLPVTNPVNEQLIGSDVVINTEHLVYFNKLRGTFRMLDCCVPAAPATTQLLTPENNLPVEKKSGK